MVREKIFLIHGLFMHGAIMGVMRRRLEKRGYDVEVFSYKSVSVSIDSNAHALAEFVKQHQESGVVNHFVGHSLGGILIRLAYEYAPEVFTGRIVTIGTPHQGSQVATRVAREVHHAIIGGAFPCGLDGNLPPWRGDCELGSIAGTVSIGLASVLPEIPVPNDGAVAVAETQLDHQTDSVSLPLSHTALVYSSRVIKCVDYFLAHGRFQHD